MTLELNPVGVACNLRCAMCYENPLRDAGNLSAGYDVDAMIRALDEEGGPFSVFGGEPLLMPIRDLERVFEHGFRKHGHNGIQTNGTLITPTHVGLFARYNVHVGISLEGPGELNDGRWAGSLAKTREATAKSEAAIEALCGIGRPPSLIITLCRNNAVGERLERLKAWLHYLDSRGVGHVRLHLMEIDNDHSQDRLALTTEENTAAMLELARFELELPHIRFDFFREIVDLLRAKDQNVSCVWHACDPYTTPAVRGVDGDGSRTNCARTNKDGVAFRKADTPGHERQLALYHTPQEYGGCHGCRFFILCKGECPGTGEGSDWRNRTDHCGTLMALFTHYERKLLELHEVPLSLSPQREVIEARLIQEWASGAAYVSLSGSGGTHGDSHGDGHGDGHGDMPHGDSHGDSGPVVYEVPVVEKEAA